MCATACAWRRGRRIARGGRTRSIIRIARCIAPSSGVWSSPRNSKSRSFRERRAGVSRGRGWKRSRRWPVRGRARGQGRLWPAPRSPRRQFCGAPGRRRCVRVAAGLPLRHRRRGSGDRDGMVQESRSLHPPCHQPGNPSGTAGRADHAQRSLFRAQSRGDPGNRGGGVPAARHGRRRRTDPRAHPRRPARPPEPVGAGLPGVRRQLARLLCACDGAGGRGDAVGHGGRSDARRGRDRRWRRCSRRPGCGRRRWR